MPKNLFTAGLAWQATPAWRNYVGIRYTAGMYLDVAHTIPQGGFAVVDLSSSYDIGNGVDVFASIVNLFNERYSDSATTSASSSILGMPFALTAGLRWQF